MLKKMRDVAGILKYVELKDLMRLEEYCTVEPLLSSQGSALWPLNRGGR